MLTLLAENLDKLQHEQPGIGNDADGLKAATAHEFGQRIGGHAVREPDAERCAVERVFVKVHLLEGVKIERIY